MKVLLLAVFAFLVFAQCPSQNSDKELELKEKELALKEKELELKSKEKDSDVVIDAAPKKAATKAEPAAEKKSDPPKSSSSSSSGSKGCSLTNRVQFAKGTSAQTFKCSLDTNTGNTKHRYLLAAEAGQDLTITFNSTAASYEVVAPKGAGRFGPFYGRESIPLTEDGTWIINVNITSGSSYSDYTVNYEIK